MPGLIHKHMDFFNFLSKLPKKQKIVLIKNLSDPQITAIAELALNLLSETFKLKPSDKKVLRMKKNVIRKLATRGSTTQARRKLIASNASLIASLIEASFKVLKNESG